MSKGLEALERLMAKYYEMCQDLGNNDDEYQRYNLTSERATIEKELKELEELQQVLDDFKIYNIMNLIDTLKNIRFIEELNAVNSKKLKALKIIEENCVSVIAIRICDTVEEYNYRYINSTLKQLTKENFDLLKEAIS